MDFYDILDQVIDLLKQRERVSYRALKMQFDLSDDGIEALKDELIEVHQLARDQDGRMLIWTGGTELPPPAPASASASPPPVQQVITQQELSTQIASPPSASHTPEAERRQLTVMFCDLVDSTKLSSQLDPEDYRDVVRAYQTACTEVIRRYDGHIAQLLGDGLLVYFGYPQAHEDDAQRAIRAGLGIIEAVEALNGSLEPAKGITLAVRLGIHTGLVVVGEMGSQGRQEQLALGEVPNVCARIQGLAEPNTVAISAATYQLVQGYFACQELGEYTLRGVAEPIHVYHVLQESGARGRLDVAQPRGLTPLVGRESEVTLLLERWAQAKAGQGQVVLLTGDAGIGKSRLVQILKEHVAHEPHTCWECRSVEYSQNTALFPLMDLFQRVLQWQPEESPDDKLAKLEQTLSQYRLPLEESVPLFAPLFSLPVSANRYPLLNLSPQRQRQKTLEAIVTILLELAEHQPVLFIIEDLHWTDPSTLELLNLVLDQTPTASLLVLLTCRPTFQPNWTHRSYLTEITVHRLARNQIEQMTEEVAGGKSLPVQVLTQIIEKTDGVPLFIEELTKAVLEAGMLEDVGGQYVMTGTLSSFAIPATLQDSLMARLDRLVTSKAVAQYAAVIGRQFSYELLEAVSRLDPATLQRELERLVAVELLYQRGLPPQATYTFKHALIQDTAYQSLLKSTRQHYHQRIAHVLETQFSETAETQPELLAHHCTEAGLIEHAITYWHRAAQRAAERSAHVEAISHLTTGLALLQTLPETPECTQHKVEMYLALGASLIAAKGYTAPEVEQTYTHARHLCQHLAEPHQLFPVLRGLWMYYFVRAEYQTAHDLGEQLLTLARQVQDAAMLVAAHRALGSTLFHLGAFTSAHTHLAQGLALYDPQQQHASALLYGEDAGVTCRSYAVWTLWWLGYPDQGRTQMDAALAQVQQMAYPFDRSFVLSFAAVLHQCRREVQVAQERAEAAIRLATEQGFPYWMAYGAILRGWALAHQGHAQAEMEQIKQGLRAFRATGAEIGRQYFLTLLAEAYGTMGQPEAGLMVLAEALVHVEHTGDRYYTAEIHRLQGELLLRQNLDNQAEAETCFQQAIAIAQNQQAKSLELRAATSLARLWQQQGKRQEAQDLLAPVYHWFTEGFDTADLQDAKALLEVLEEERL